MLTLDRLVVENFGPYRGPQEITFGSERGVYIFYGANGRGKTTLHNGFRYALYGQIRGRRGDEHPRNLVNKDFRKQEGYGAFTTVLDFRHDRVEYRLTRRYNERESPSEIMILERSDIPLSQEESKRVLLAIAPPSVSQFSMFDGEYIGKYEELLDNDSGDGAALEESIERVLGLPIVANAKTDIRAAQQSLTRELQGLLAANKETERMAVSLKEQQDMLERRRESADKLKKIVEEGRIKLDDAEDQIRLQSKGELLLGRLDWLKSQMSDLEQREESAVTARNAQSGLLWRAVLSRSASRRLIEVDSQVSVMEDELRAAAAVERDLAHLRREPNCPVCRREISDELREELTRNLENDPASASNTSVDELLVLKRAEQKALRLLAADNSALIAERDRMLREIRLDIQNCREEIDDVERQLKEFGKNKIRLLLQERDDLRLKLSKDEERLKGERDEIQRTELDIAELTRKMLKQRSAKTDGTLGLKATACQDLINLFSDSIAVYRNMLRTRVEESASEIFRTLSGEQDYVGLRITDRYGLQIVDRDGDVVRRSAGYEHLVALALIAALQESAAVRGPVIMDYPFGRLDADHTAKAVASLPRMARQVILLAFESEFDRNAALMALGPSLIAEYELERVSSTHTTIERKAV